MRDVDSLSTTSLLLVFVVGAAVTWIAGLFLSDATEIIDDRFGLGEALGGLILLGIAGTLPEIAITASAALSGHLGLATGNLLGGIAMQTLVLVMLDAASRSKTPLSTLSLVLEPIIEAVFVIMLVTMALLGPLLPASVAIGPVSPISILIVITWFFGLLVMNRLRKNERWSTAAQSVEAAMAVPTAAAAEPAPDVKPNRFERSKTKVAVTAFALASGVTLIAGVVLEQSGNALANDWGINGVVFGATILAAVTALPEISTGIRAVRLGQVGLAMGDIFGGNQVQMTLFLMADLLAGKPVLQTVSASSSWLGGIGVIVTAVFAGGLIMRPPRKVIGVGPDSLLVVVFYAIGLAGLLRIS
jgi:cation:H+ antiporter